MAVIESGHVIEGAMGDPLRYAGTPGGGTSEIQTLTFGGTWIAGETFYLTFEGFETAAIAWSATNATLVGNIDAALEALVNIGTGGVATAVDTMTAGLGTITVTFGGNLAKKAVATISRRLGTTVAGTLAVAETTPGVDATFRGAPKGALAVDTSTGTLYINTGTGLAPTWTVVGGQS
jgi:hypothetical protein